MAARKKTVADFPKIAAEWHPTKNEALKPDQIAAGSSKKCWWKCTKSPDHEWQATIANRAGSNKTGCPFCRGLRVSVANSLATQFPDVAAEWHPSKNGDLTSGDVTRWSGRKVWWRCSVDSSHEWESTIANRTSGNGCPQPALAKSSLQRPR